MKNKILATIIILSLSLSVLSGCGQKGTNTSLSTQINENESATDSQTASDTSYQTSGSASISDASASDANGHPVSDRSGASIKVPAKINSIISLAPSTTQILIDLGLSDKIIAIDTNSAVFADQLPSGIPQFDMMNPDNESLVKLSPDIVFTSGMSSGGGKNSFQSAIDAGICCADIPSSTSFKDIEKDISFIGACTDTSSKAASLNKTFNDDINKIKKASSGTSHLTVLFMLNVPSADDPTVYSVGSGTFQDEMITAIGAENVTHNQSGWVSISEEEAVAMNPDVIITNADYMSDAAEQIKSSASWKAVNAVKNNKVFLINGNSSNQPNNHIVSAMIEMAKDIYPKSYADFNDPFSTNNKNTSTDAK